MDDPGKKIKLGRGKRGSPRIYLEGLWLLKSGFEAHGKTSILFDESAQTVTLLLDPESAKAIAGEGAVVATRAVSGKRKRGKTVPVIDVQNKELDRVFGDAKELIVQAGRNEIRITRTMAQELREERERAKPNNWEVSLYSGAGLLSLAAEQAGAKPVLAIERWDKAVQALVTARRGLRVLEAPVQEVALAGARHQDRFRLPRNPYLLTAGVPCEPYSRKGGKGLKACDPHELADQALYTVSLIWAMNPINVILENVPEFLDVAGSVVQALRYVGYHVAHDVLDPAEFGYATRRPRSVIVATTAPGFSFPKRRGRKLSGQSLRELLLVPDDPYLSQLPARQGGWFSVKEGEKKHRAWVKAGKPLDGNRIPSRFSGLDQNLFNWLHGRDSKGRKKKGHPAKTFEYSDAVVPTITKTMHKTDPQGPYLHHPRKRDLYRLLTTEEVGRLLGVPRTYAQKVYDSADGRYSLVTELYGQGVHVPLFREVVERLPGGRRVPRTITVKGSVRNPAPVVPMYYGSGPLYSALPWGWL